MNSAEAMEVLDGLMLGDAGLCNYRSGAIFCLTQSKILAPRHYPNQEQLRAESLFEHMKWLRWIAENPFKVLSISVCKDYPKVLSCMLKGKPYKYACLRTPQSPVFTSMWEEWYAGGEWTNQHQRSRQYVHGMTKVIPKRIMHASNMTTSTLVQWFRGDGNSSWDLREGRTPYCHVGFSTYCFTEEEVYHLMAMLYNAGLNTRKPSKQAQIRGSGLGISLSENSVGYFLNLIEPHVREVFGLDSLTYRDMITREPDYTLLKLSPSFAALRRKLCNVRRYSEA